MFVLFLSFILLFSTVEAAALEKPLTKINSFFTDTTEPFLRHVSCYTSCNQVFGKSFGRELSACFAGNQCLKADIIKGVLSRTPNKQANPVLSKGYFCIRSCRIKTCYKFLCQVLGQTNNSSAIEGLALSLMQLQQSWKDSKITTLQDQNILHSNMLKDFLDNPKFHKRCTKLFRHDRKMRENYIRNREILEKVNDGAPRENRTPTSLRTVDFESTASTNSTTGASE